MTVEKSVIGLIRFCDFADILSIQKAKVAAYVFCRWNNLTMMPTPRSVLVWVKNNWSMGDLEHEHGRQWEACCFYPQKEHQFVTRIPDVLTVNRTDNYFHPTEKPVALMSKLIAANKVKTVLDPFAGSGTTLVAAKKLGCKAIGIEIEESYCQTTVKRLAQNPLVFSEAV